MWKKLWKVDNLKYVVGFLIPVFFVVLMMQWIDNDSWGVLAEGRYIANNGLYSEDVLSMHSGLHVSIQNYAFAVIFYWIHSMFGAQGLYVVMLILNFVILILLYKICMLISKGNVNLSLILMVITDVVLAFAGFITTRAQMIDYVVFLALIYVLELYIKTDKSKYLWWIPVFSLVQANLHAAMWWAIFAIILTYLIDAIKKPKFLHTQGYRVKPLVLTTLIAIAVGLINPYGFEMVTSIFTSYSGLAGLDFVAELTLFDPISGVGILFYLTIVAIITLYAFGRGENVRIRYLLMLFGFLMIGLHSIKGLSELALTMFFPLALLYKDWKMPKLLYKNRIGGVKINEAILVWTSVVVICMAGGILLYRLCNIEDRPSESAELALDAIDKEVGEENREDAKVYVGYNGGGYVEYRGYKAYIDPRGVEFLKSANGKEDILTEWLDVKDGKIAMKDFLTKYNFDFLYVQKYEDAIYEVKDERYELIYSNEEYGDRVFKRI